MSSLKNHVLVLNSGWVPIDVTSVKDAIIAMTGGVGSPALGLNIENTEEGVNFYPVKWVDWIRLPIRKGDKTIYSVKFSFRCPTIIIQGNFNKIPIGRHSPTSRAIALRDNWTCQYTNRPLTKNDFTLDHVIPREKGGKSTWENLVACHKDINTIKANKTPDQAGLRLLKKPVAPKAVPRIDVILSGRNVSIHPDWNHFLIKN